MRITTLVAGLLLLLLLLSAACDTPPPPSPTPDTPIFSTEAPPTPTLVADAAGETDPALPQPPEESDPSASTDTPATAPPTTTATPTVGPPTPTPAPEERITLARRALEREDVPVAIAQLEALLTGELPADQQQWARFELGRLYLEEGFNIEAAALFEMYMTDTGPAISAAGATHGAQAAFYLAEARAAAGDFSGAAAAYATYLAANPDMAAYVEPRRAAALAALGDAEGELAAYERAVAGSAHRVVAVTNRLWLAQRYESLARYADGVAQYLAILEIAQTDQTRGQALYNAGRLTVLAGDREAGFDYYRRAIDEHPEAYDSYLALVALVDAGVPVDEYQRGVVDYYAGAYEVGIAAFERYIISNTLTVSDTIQLTYRPDTHLYMGWSYEGLGNVPAAVAQFDAYALYDPDDPALAARAQLETAKLYARAGRWSDARTAYNAYVDQFPEGADAPFAAWWGARLTELAPDSEEAIRRYQFLADTYPTAEQAPEAAFRAGWLQHESGDLEGAHATWRGVRERFPGTEFAAASLVWLVREEAATDATAPGFTYYDFRARDLLEEVPAFATIDNFAFESDPAEVAEAKAWVAAQLGEAAPADPGALAPPLAADPRLIRGTRLWELGLEALARQELESLRVAYARDLAASYQLALYFRDLGLYRSSILAANSMLILSGSNVLTAPREIGRLLYPAHYAELVLQLAEQYGYDPLLQLALIRQESLFESFAASPVGAQGLSQVMPATGDYIAAQLGWPNYETADLNRPWVGLNFGAFYLDQQLDAFDGAVHAALAAYNAGPGNAARWYDDAGDDLDRFVEILDFPETRTYVERIYVGHAIYRYLYGQ